MARGSIVKAYLLLVSSLCLLQESHAWVSNAYHVAARLTSSSNSRPFALTTPLAVASLTVESLHNHDQVGSELALSVQRWLDNEWMIQNCHVRIGTACKKAYVQCRDKRENDLMVIMMSVAETLQDDWQELYDDAFVNAWDISNYVSDYLTAKVGIEGCECSAKIY